jgi:hypothetical protein
MTPSRRWPASVRVAAKPPSLFFMAAVFVAAGLPRSLAAEPFRSLFNGRDLSGWDMYMAVPDPAWDVPTMTRGAGGKYTAPIGADWDPLKVFNVETIDGVPTIHITGQGFGTITTRESFANFHLRLQMKWGERKWGYKIGKPRDSGLLYFCHGQLGFEHKTWPRSIEFQIQEHDCGDLFALDTQVTVNARKGGGLWLYDPRGEPTLFLEKRPVGNRCVKLVDMEKPHGEWNTIDLVCLGADSIHVVNGKVVMRLQNAQRLDGDAPAPLASGRISLQTEGAEVFFRDIKVTPITAVPPQYADE